MSEGKTYERFKIPDRVLKARKAELLIEKENTAISLEDNGFAEIEVSLSGADNAKLPVAQAIKPPSQKDLEKEKLRKVFGEMRDISRYNHASYFLNTNFYQKQVQYENSKIFYKQGKFMQDLEDDYADTVPFSSYFPYYQHMNYEQLRTYFTWRTKVRQGKIENCSLSYAFVYVYELLNNIGVENSDDGLQKLMEFWRAFKQYDSTIEKYLLKWVKDYHIYYGVSKPFKYFIAENKLQSHYPEIVGFEPQKMQRFDYLCEFSKYDIRQSKFYSEENRSLIAECFEYVICKLQQTLAGAGIQLFDMIFKPSKSKAVWTPFKGALFFPHTKQEDRRVVLSESEIYTCNQNRWLVSTIIPVESGKRLIGYVLKQMEVTLRRLQGYKYKLSANVNTMNEELLVILAKLNISLEKEVSSATLELYREKTKTVVSVDSANLSKIRLEALSTQEKLIVPESDLRVEILPFEPIEAQIEPQQLATVSIATDEWTSLAEILTEVELSALSIIIESADIKQFADRNAVMVEVLADGINEKAFDVIGDSVLDECMELYSEYKEKIIGMVRKDGNGK